MVEDGTGVAILPASAAPDLDGIEVRVIPLSDAWARRRLGLCLRSPEDLTPQARLLREHLGNFAFPAM